MSFRNKSFLAIVVLFLAGAIVLPFVSVEAGRNKLYVNREVSGTQDGSSNHPYKTIQQALDKANSNTDIHVAKGTYKENIRIPKGVKLFGSSKKEVIIDGDSDESTIRMKHKTEVNKITVKGGEYGIYVEGSSRVSIIDCIIKDNKKDGIKVKESNRVKDSYMVSVSKSNIEDNGKSGIFAEKGRLSLIDNFISENKGDGLDIGKGSRVWLDNNTIKENGRSGIKLVLDKSDIWMKKNSVHNNTREGMEISSFGEGGSINVDKSKFYENGRYGIARVSRGTAGAALWSGLTVQANTQYWGNVLGNLSGVVRVK